VFDIQPDLFWFMFFSVTSIPVIVMAVLVLLGAGVKAKEMNAPYWQVLKPGLRKFVIGVAIFYVGIIFMGIVTVFLLFLALGAFSSK